MKERLQKILAAHGVASRRASEVLIARGAVRVNGQVACVGDSADIESDAIEVSGRPLRPMPEKLTILLHKPRGVVTTLSDEKGRKTVRDLVQGAGARLVPVGRLDIDTEGLLLMTNDGALVQRLTHPSHQVEKEYHVLVTLTLKTEAEAVAASMDAAMEMLEKPMDIDGHRVKAVRVIRLGVRENGEMISITICQGRHRQIRKMCETVGLTVRRLCRVRVGSLTLEGVRYGQWRKLTPAEVKKLNTPEYGWGVKTPGIK